MLTLKKIITAHDRSSNKESLKYNLGDGFLLSNNPVYRNVRIAVKSLGYKFSKDNFIDYAVHKLGYLPTLLQEKKIPYCDNVSVMRKFTSLRLDSFDWNNTVLPLQNFLLHESSHAIARKLTKLNHNPKMKNILLSDERNSVFLLLFEESFANTCEVMAWGYAKPDLHKIFLEQNSYQPPPGIDDKISDFIKKFGFNMVFGILLLSYVHSNFLFKKLSKKQFYRSLKLISECFPDETNKKLLKKETAELFILFCTGLNLSIDFRLHTSRFYFNFIGLKTDLFQLLDFDFMKIFEENSLYQSYIKKMAKILQAGIV